MNTKTGIIISLITLTIIILLFNFFKKEEEYLKHEEIISLHSQVKEKIRNNLSCRTIWSYNGNKSKWFIKKSPYTKSDIIEISECLVIDSNLKELSLSEKEIILNNQINSASQLNQHFNNNL